MIIPRIIGIPGLLLMLGAATVQAQYTNLHTFTGGATDGSLSKGSVVLSGPTLYGMTSSGGTPNKGTIFKVNTDGSSYSLMHSFTSGVSDGASPIYSSLTPSGTNLYGLTSSGGSGNGVLFKISTDGTGYTNLHSFAGGASEGGSPYGSLTQTGTYFYGTTAFGGTGSKGVIFRINVDGTAYTNLHVFIGGTTDGQYPYGSLTQSGTNLYGMASGGGSASAVGVIFRINIDGTGYANLHSFTGGVNDGATPYGSLTQSGTNFYGMAYAGGSSNNGVVFKINADGSGYTNLHSFAGGTVDGKQPYGSLTLSGTTLLGMAYYGGTSGFGTVFALNTDGSGYTNLHSFASGVGDGKYPYGTLAISNASMYGLTYQGGTNSDGVVFSLTLANVATAVTPANSGSASGGGFYGVGTNIQLTATASNGWQFASWNDGTTNNPYSIVVPPSNITYTASFAPVATISVGVSTNVGGYVTGGGVYFLGSNDVLTAVESNGWHFLYWSDGVTNNPRTVVVASNMTYTAVFVSSAWIYTQANPPAGGSVTGGGNWLVNSSQLLTVTASNLWRFVGWSDGDTNNPRTVVVPAQGGTYTANFSPLGVVSTLANPTNAGSTAGDGQYIVGSNAMVTAVASNHWALLNWNGSLTNNPWVFSVTSGTTVCTANFALVSQVTVLANPTNGGSAAGSGAFFVGSNATLTATAATDWKFSVWNDGDTNAQRSIVVANTDTTYTASFAAAATIVVGANTNAGGFVTGGGLYFLGSNEVLTATASNRWQFIGWSDGVTNNPRTVVVASDLTYTALFAPTAVLTVQASPVAGGSVSGGGTYLVGSNAVLAVTESNNWRFVGWNDGVTNNPRTVVMPAGDITYTANFSPLGTVSTLANPGNGGSQTGDGQYIVGSNAMVTAVASNRWMFLNWNGSVTNNPWVFSVTSGTTVCTASYLAASTVTVLASPTNGGSVAGGGMFFVGSNATLTAAAAGNWKFFGWNDGDTNVLRTITVSATDSTYTATFAPAATITVNANTNAGGSVTGGGYFFQGSNDVLTATASNRWQFIGWSDGVTNNPRTVVVASNVTFTATFAPTVVINVLSAPVAGGSVAGGGTYVVGSNAVLTVTESNNWRFVGWNDSVTNNPRTVVVPSGDITYTANFSPLGTVSTLANPSAGGSQTGDGQYFVGSNATVTAVASNRWMFLNWNGSVTNNPWVFSVTSGTTVCTASYLAASTVTVLASPTNGGSVAGGGMFFVGSNATLSVAAASNWKFFGWNDGDTNVLRTITVSATDSTYTASFAPAATITVNANTNAGGSVTGGGYFFQGSNDVLVATASNNWRFIGWSDGVTNNPRTVVVASNVTFTATFAPTVVINVLSAPTAGGSVTGGGTYVVGSNAVLTVTESNNWRFVGWSDSGTNNPRTVVVPASSTTYTANFSPLGTVATLANPSNGGNQLGDGQYLVSSNAMVTAVASNHWTFLNWNGSITNNPWTFSVTSGTTVCTANYAAATMVTVLASPTNSGGVAGGGGYLVGSNAILTATSSGSWLFLAWNDGNTNALRSIVVAGTDSTYTAFFVPAATVTVGVNTNAGGSVTGGGVYVVGSNEVVTATASNNWRFIGWSDGVTNNPRTVVVASNVTYTATFAPTVVINVLSAPAAGGSVAGGGTYVVGSNAVLTVTESNNWRFVGWSDSGTNNPRTVVVPAVNTTYTANFSPLGTVATWANPTNGGSQTGGGQYLVGSNAMVTAVASNRWLFLNWNGSVTNNPWVFSVTSGATVCTANYGAASTVTVQASPTNGGSAAGGGVFFVGSNATLTAVASSNWMFFAWNDGNTNAVRSITVPALDSTNTATFGPAATITVGVNTNAGGSVTGGGYFFLGSNEVVTATASNGWQFMQWNDGVTNNPRTVTVGVGGANYSAIFAPTAVLMAQASPLAGGSVTGGGTYVVGSNALLTVTASNNWQFTGWSDSVTNNPRTVVVPAGGATYTANFSPLGTVSLLASPANAGSLTGAGQYLVGSNAMVTAVASNHWLFLNWNGSVTNNPWVFSVTSGATVCTANFAAASTVTVQASPTNGGSATGGGTFFVGSNATLTAIASSNWLFIAWNDGNTNALRSITVPAPDSTNTAYFALSATITVGVNTNAGGSVTGGGVYVVGSNEVVTATASNGWRFIGWNDGVTNNPRTVMVASNVTYTATFAPTAVLIAQASPAAGGSVLGGGTYLVGSNAVLTVTASNNWRFTGWTDSVTNNPRTVVVPAGGATYTANFSPLGTVSTLANPTNGGSQTGDGQYLVGSNAMVTAVASNRWLFLNWNGSLTNNPWVFSVTSGATVCTANYAQISTVTVLPSPVNGGSVAGGGVCFVGSNATLTASPSNGWTFFAWNDGNTNAQRSVTVPASDSTYTAYFATVTSITVGVNTNDGGYVTGGGLFLSGSTNALTATASNGWQFVQWNDGVTNNPRTVVVGLGGANYTAIFAPTAAINAQVSPANGGSVTGSGTYVVGSNAVLTVTESNNWRFVGWNDSATNNPRTVVVPAGGATYTANFSPLGTVSTLANPTNGGSQTGDGQYLVGSNAMVTAVASNRWLFLNWNGSVTNNPWVFSVTSGATVCTANFAAASTVTVQASPTNAGSAAGGGTFFVGSNATLMAMASNNWLFIGWNDGNTNALRTVTVSATDTTYMATFAPAATITVGVNTNVGGSVVGGGVYLTGHTDVLAAIASNGWRFISWSDGITANPRLITVSTNQMYVATFAPTAVLTVQASPAAGGSVTGAGTYLVGGNTLLTATASNNWQFISWNDGATSPARMVPVPAGGASYTAIFHALGTVVVLASPTNGGSVTGGGSYLTGPNVAVTATASNGWQFLNWNGGLTNNPWVFSVTSGTSVCTAQFARLSTVTVLSSATNLGTVTGGGIYIVGSTCVLAAATQPGWALSSWNDGNTQNPRAFIVPPTNVTLIASFAVSPGSLALGNALNATNLFWQTGGDGTWSATTADSRDGQAAQSSPLVGGQQAWLQVVTNGPGSLVFWWKISSELTDTLQFSVNGVLQSQLITSTGWQQYAVYLGSTNAYTLRWTFAKNSYSAAGGNGGFLDQVSWSPCAYATNMPQVFYQDPTGLLVSWVLNSTGGMQIARTLANTGGWVLKTAGDIDGDGVSDLLFQNAAGATLCWFMNADGSTRSACSLLSLPGYEIKACGDYEGIGQAQLFVQNTAAVGNVYYFRLDAAGSNLSAVSLGAMGGWKLRGIGDLDGDGKAELIWQDASGNMSIWYHNANGTIRATPVVNMGTWAVCGLVDIDGDGTPDLLWQNPGGTTAAWFMNAHTTNGTPRAASAVWNTGAWKLKAAGR